MDVTEKIRLVTREPTEEVVTQEELLNLFNTNSQPKHYIGLEI
ncbi:MAG TPA: tyrosine--tRNA ligase, partial [Candidatus Nitrosotalea sp.]|nr:tyrosine--tRNA ligase [Candidatus Nitrosotalea sp.]